MNGKSSTVPEAERLHSQDHAGQRRAQDFRVGEARPVGEILLVVEPDADAVADPPAAPGALVGCGLADRLDLQLLDLVAVAVALDARGAGVDHILDARHRQRGFGNVGRQHDAPRAVRLEDAVLLGLAQSREQRHHLDAGRMVLAQGFRGIADLAFAGQEHQHVAAADAAAPEFVDRIGDGLVRARIRGSPRTGGNAARPETGVRTPGSPAPARAATRNAAQTDRHRSSPT